MNERDFQKLVELYKKTSILESSLRTSLVREAVVATAVVQEAAMLKSITRMDATVSAEQRAALGSLQSTLENLDGIMGRIETSANQCK